jgi:hypothetical protein
MFNATVKQGSAGGQSGLFETGSSDAYNASYSSISPHRNKFSNLKPKVDNPRMRKNNQGANTNFNTSRTLVNVGGNTKAM